MFSHTKLTTLMLFTSGMACAVATAGDVQLNQSNTMITGGPGTVVTTFNLFDHPGGGINPQAYGLRMDSFTDSGDPVTFTFEDTDGNSSVQLVVMDTGSGLTLNINGTVFGNSASGGTNYGSFLLNLTYSIDSVALGWEDNNASAGQVVGGLTGIDTTIDSTIGNGDFMSLAAMSDGSDSLRFLADGFRNAGSDSQWVGRGWLSNMTNGNQGTNDLLFTAVVVPLPPVAIGGLAMLTGMGVYRRIRASRN